MQLALILPGVRFPRAFPLILPTKWETESAAKEKPLDDAMVPSAAEQRDTATCRDAVPRWGSLRCMDRRNRLPAVACVERKCVVVSYPDSLESCTCREPTPRIVWTACGAPIDANFRRSEKM